MQHSLTDARRGQREVRLVPEVARALGYLRTGTNVQKAARGAVTRLVKTGLLIERGGFLVPSGG